MLPCEAAAPDSGGASSFVHAEPLCLPSVLGMQGGDPGLPHAAHSLGREGSGQSSERCDRPSEGPAPSAGPGSTEDVGLELSFLAYEAPVYSYLRWLSCFLSVRSPSGGFHISRNSAEPGVRRDAVWPA